MKPQTQFLYETLYDAGYGQSVDLNMFDFLCICIFLCDHFTQQDMTVAAHLVLTAVTAAHASE